MESAIWNPQSGIRDLESAIWNLQSLTLVAALRVKQPPAVGDRMGIYGIYAPLPWARERSRAHAGREATLSPVLFRL